MKTNTPKETRLIENMLIGYALIILSIFFFSQRCNAQEPHPVKLVPFAVERIYTDNENCKYTLMYDEATGIIYRNYID